MIKLDKNEKVILEVRKHWFILFAETLFLVLLLLLPIIVIAGARFLEISGFIEVAGNEIFLYIILTSTWLVFVWITFFVIWTDYYLDILIVTNKRVIDINQKGLFNREVSTFKLDRMQDITTEIYGLIATLLKFGNIQLQTAGETNEFIIKGIPDPVKVKRQILDIYNNVVENKKNQTQ